MGVFRNFPYSNFHEMNMDEIIKIIKNMLEEWARYYAEWDTWMSEINEDWSNYQDVMNTAWQNMQNFINNYFDNLDVQNEINNKITSMVNSGEFATIVEPYIPPRVTAWLAEHITQPVGVVIDTSLSVAGACADAKATGDAINDLKSDINVTNESIKDGLGIIYTSGLDIHNGSLPNVGNDHTVYTSYAPIGVGTVTINVKRPLDVNGDYYTFGYAIYDASKNIIGGIYNNEKQRDLHKIINITDPNARYIRYTIAEVDTSNNYITLRETDFDKYDVVVEMVLNDSIVKIVSELKPAVDTLTDEIVNKLDADYSKNICNAFDTNNVVDNTYTIYSNGRLTNLSDWCSIQFRVIGGRNISTNVNGAHIAFFSQYNDITNADVPSILSGYISGTTGILSGYTVPESAKYAVISIPISQKSYVQVEYGNTQTSYVPYIKGINVNKVIGLNIPSYIEYDLYADGSGDFTDLKSCLESITNSSKTNQYIINIHPGTYDIGILYDDYTGTGLMVPNYVTLRGIGDKHNIIILAELENISTSFSVLNLKDVCSIENLTIKSKNCRYTIHDDYQSNRDTECIRNIKNVIFVGENCGYGSVYGSGLKGLADWYFENCEFDATKASAIGGPGNAFSNHNNINVTKPSFIKFVNCRLLNNSPTYKTVRLNSMTTGSDNGTVTVTFDGNKIDGIHLGENDPALYGSGILYWVNGFGNVNTLGVTINNTDEHDYSNNVDLI